MIVDYIEVYNERELPLLPAGKKYFLCIGGNKNYQCFIEDSSMSRGVFLHKYQECLADCLQPVFITEYIQVRQDAQYAVPGFFIVSPVNEYIGLLDTPDEIICECLVWAERIREKLLKHSDIKAVYVFYDENYTKPTSTHFWVLPIFSDNLCSITRSDIWEYIKSFVYSESKENIAYWIEYIKNGE